MRDILANLDQPRTKFTRCFRNYKTLAVGKALKGTLAFNGESESSKEWSEASVGYRVKTLVVASSVFDKEIT